MIRKNAFTLAEVLITLTIIGVIAALTIPNLMQKWQKEATITKLKKGYNSVTRMANLLKQNTNCDTLECIGFPASSYGNSIALTKRVVEILTNETSAKNHSTYSSYPPPHYRIKDIDIYRSNWQYPVMLNSNNGSAAHSFQDFIVTSDGIIYNISMENNSLVIAVITEPLKKIICQNCVGDRKTIKIGRNFFLFVINNNFETKPYTAHGCVNNWGSACAAKIIADGWKMNY